MTTATIAPTFTCAVCETETPAILARRCRIPTVLHVCPGCYEVGIEDGACNPFDCDLCGVEIPWSPLVPNWTHTLHGYICDESECPGYALMDDDE